MNINQCEVLTGALSAAAGGTMPESSHAHGHYHDHQAVPSDLALRVKALESLLVEKGLVDPRGPWPSQFVALFLLSARTQQDDFNN